MRIGIITLVSVAALSACDGKSDVAESKMEREAETQAIAAGPTEAALGLSEAQLLKAELIGRGDVEIGDVVKVERDAAGKVDRLLVEIEDSNPDRFVYVPISKLKPILRGAETDLKADMTLAELNALPEVKLPAH